MRHELVLLSILVLLQVGRPALDDILLYSDVRHPTTAR